MDVVHDLAVAMTAYEGLKARQRAYYQRNKEFIKKKREFEKQGIILTKRSMKITVGTQTDK